MKYYEKEIQKQPDQPKEIKEILKVKNTQMQHYQEEIDINKSDI